eukprot:g9443.t1
MGVAHSSAGLTCLENPPKKNNSGKPYSVVVPNTETSERGATRRCGLPHCHQGPVLALNGAQTSYESFRRGVSVNPDGPCLGRREVDSEGNPTPYIFETYLEVEERIDHFAAGLEQEGLTPPNPDGMKLLALYSRNRPEWVIAEQATFAHSGLTVPLYDTLGPETVEFVINQTALTTVVCAGVMELKKLVAIAEGRRCPSLQAVVTMDGVSERDRAEAVKVGLRVYAFGEVEGIGASHLHAHPHRPPAATDLATFCYTSGTTGNPKGALLTHRNFMADAAASEVMQAFDADTTDVYLSYLPLPHIFERMVQIAVFNVGASVGFFRGDPTLLVEDMQALRPTSMPVVPRVLNRFHDKIVQGMLAAGGLKTKLFIKACEAKVQGLHEGRATHALWDKLVFGKIKAALGLDRIRMLVTGSAPVAVHVLTFMRILVGVPLLEGYGQTETTAGATITQNGDFSAGHVGGPFSCTEISLKDVPEMGYRHTDTWHGADPRDAGGGGVACDGRGEVCFRGNNVFVGYYKEDEKTREAFDQDGWLMSGDIGMWTTDGALKIIDRKKNIFKLSQGEYVAPEKLENVHTQSPLVAQSYVHGDSLRSYLVAVVVPDAEAVAAWAKANGCGSASVAELCRNPRLKADVMQELDTVAERAGLQRFEKVRAIHLEAEPFSPQNGLLTPTLKLKRAQALEAYSKVITNLYASSGEGGPTARL